ncbi:MAG: polyprenyl synthetase family protein [Planctomycetaceae bacterium]
MDPLLASWRQIIEDRLRVCLECGSDCPGRLREAMAYSLLGGGKRLRPLLVLIACEACGGDVETALPAACAIEMVHTYSLIHDDLPAMDDDDLRRGRPTCHRQFDEGTAILAGDALLTLAFEVIAAEIVPPAVAAACCADLARAAGMCGMVGGQMADLEQAGGSSQQSAVSDQRSGAGNQRLAISGQRLEVAPAGPSTLSLLESVHRRKTGRLLCSALTMGGRIAGADPQTLGLLATYGESIGLAFQIVDDLLDVRGDSTTMGKQVRKDDAAGKLTYPGLLGEAESRRRAEGLIENACRAVAVFGERGQRLEAMAHFVIARDR